MFVKLIYTKFFFELLFILLIIYVNMKFIIILIIVYLIYDLWFFFSFNNIKKKVEIKNDKINIINEIKKNIIPLSNPIKSNKGCYHYADIGLTCPTEVHNNIYDIIPFQYIDKYKQQIVVNYLNLEWGKKKNYTIDTILDEWPLIDALYILTNKNKYKNNIIGFIAIDRKFFFPFLSHLYVKSEMRGKGYGTILIDFAIKTVKLQGFKKCKLWCEKNQINYYIKKGWYIEYNQDNIYILAYDLLQ